MFYSISLNVILDEKDPIFVKNLVMIIMRHKFQLFLSEPNLKDRQFRMHSKLEYETKNINHPKGSKTHSNPKNQSF